MGMTVDVFAIPAAAVGDVLAERESFEQFESISLEKAWHGLHFLLTGDAWETEGPAAFIVGGGAPLDGVDAGYGLPRLFMPDEVQQIHAKLNSTDGETLWSRYDSDAMTTEGVYPDIWDEPEEDLKEEYLFYFTDLKNLVSRAAGAGQGLVVFLA